MMTDVPSASPAVLIAWIREMKADGGTARYAILRSLVVAARIALRSSSGGSGTNRSRFAKEVNPVFRSGVRENCLTAVSARSRNCWSLQSNGAAPIIRSEEHTSELQSRPHL